MPLRAATLLPENTMVDAKPNHRVGQKHHCVTVTAPKARMVYSRPVTSFAHKHTICLCGGAYFRAAESAASCCKCGRQQTPTQLLF